MTQIIFTFIINYLLKFAIQILLNLTSYIYELCRQKQSIDKNIEVMKSIGDIKFSIELPCD